MIIEISVEVDAEEISDSIRVMLGDLDITSHIDSDEIEEIKLLLKEETSNEGDDANLPHSNDWGEEAG